MYVRTYVMPYFVAASGLFLVNARTGAYIPTGVYYTVRIIVVSDLYLSGSYT